MAGVGLARHRAGERLSEDVLAAFVYVRSLFAKSGAKGVNDAGVDLLQALVAKAQAVHHAWPKIVDDHIRALHQLVNHIAVLRLAEVQRNAPLIAVDAEIDGIIQPIRVLNRRTRQVARARPFNFDDVGAEIAEHLRTDGAELHLTEVDDADTIKGQAHAGDSDAIGAA